MAGPSPIDKALEADVTDAVLNSPPGLLRYRLRTCRCRTELRGWMGRQLTAPILERLFRDQRPVRIKYSMMFGH